MIRALLAAAALACAPLAHAAEFDLTLSGGGTYYETGHDGPFSCGGVPACSVSWSETLEVTTTGSADGVYTGDALAAVTLGGPWAAFTYHAGDEQHEEPGKNGPVLVGMADGASVTVSGGVLSAANFCFLLPLGVVDASGTAFAIRNAAGDGAYDSWDLQGSAGAVPEPTAGVLMLCGLAALVVKRRRN